MRFTNVAGPLLDLGPVSLDGIALRLYAEVVAAGVGGGAQVELTGLSFAPGGAGGGNAVAGSILADAGQASPSARPAFSPSLAIQRHPGDEDVAVNVRAGALPGPWWLVVQRQLGPLYLERIGFNSTEVSGSVTSVTLLFDGRVEIFGLTAAVDQLLADLARRRPVRHQPLGRRPAGARGLGRPVRDLVGRRHAQDHRRRRRVLRRHAARQVRHLRAVGLRRLHRRRGQPVLLRLRCLQRTDRRTAGVLRHRPRRRAGDQPASWSSPTTRRSSRRTPSSTRSTPMPPCRSRCRRCAT